MVRVSVCIATFNGEKYVKEQIDSIIMQLSDEDEIVISDDHSTDSTISILKQYNDRRIKIFFNQKEKGYTRNFENAIRMAQGKYIFLSDQDDKWLCEKINLTLKYLDQNNYDMVISDCFVVDSNLTNNGDSYFKARGSKQGFINTIIKANYLGCCLAFNRKMLDKLLPFPSNYTYLPHDLWIGLVGYAFYNVKTTDEKLILYRRHSNNVSNGGARSKTTFMFKIQYRMYALINVLKRALK